MQQNATAVKITGSIDWVGALNPELRRFDVIMHTEYGTSYNAYLVRGEEKTALVETVKDRFVDEQLGRIRSLVNVADIDYIVLDHTEPDHSGALAEILAQCPKATVVCSRAASVFLKDIVNADFTVKVVKDGDEIDLGGRTLSFISAPYLHWPDSMFTYIKEDGVLITGDVFGSHYAGADILESKTGGEYAKAQRYYFDVIMGPFKKYVREALAKIDSLDYGIICPSHGPVLDKAPEETVKRYAEWAMDEPPLDSVFIGCVSCYGYTTQLAEQIKRALADAGIEARLYDVGLEDPDAMAQEAMRSRAIIVGSPTVNQDVLPPVWALLTRLSPIACKGKKAAVFGSYGWSGEAAKMMADRLESIGCKTLGTVKTKFRPDAKALEEAYGLGEKIAKELKE